MRILVTGVAGHLAQALLPRLLNLPGLTEVVGLDWRPFTYPHPRFRFVRTDIRDPELPRHLEHVDIVIHLAFVMLSTALGRRRRERNLMRSINLEGSRNLFNCARQAGVDQVVYPSSVAVYGAWADNPVPLTEEAQRRPIPGFGYSEDKAAVEFWLDAFERGGGVPVITRLRVHGIVGPNAQPLFNRLGRSRLYIRTPSAPPPVQFLWEDDAVDAILQSLRSRVGGNFNIAASEPRPWPELVARHHRWTMGLPYEPVQALQRLLWPVTGAFGEPGWLMALRYPLVVDCERARKDLGWRAHFTVTDCVDLCQELEPPWGRLSTPEP